MVEKKKKILPHRGCLWQLFLRLFIILFLCTNIWVYVTYKKPQFLCGKRKSLINSSNYFRKKYIYWSLRFSHVFSSIIEFSKGILAVINQIFSLVTEIILEKSVMLDLLIAEMLTVMICFKSSLSYVFYRKPVLAILGKSSWKASASCYI